MPKANKYIAHTADNDGFVHYSDDEHQVWHELITRQRKHITDRACAEYFAGLEILNLPMDRIPQLMEVSQVLQREVGWEVTRVPALISFASFFNLLADKRFPCATFIRNRDDMDYLQEPDIFHEIFGHCAMLTNPFFAEFTHTYGRLGAAAAEEERAWLARLYWFTVEFGLINTPLGERIYGGGIVSSFGETRYALSAEPVRLPFDILTVLRTPYRIDIMQPIYYVIDEMKQLYDIARMDIMAYVKQARGLGLFAPAFPAKPAQSSGGQ